MSGQKMVVPGFGIGTFYGSPSTIALDSTKTTTLTGTVLLAGQYQVAGIVTGVNISLVSTSNGVTGTYKILDGTPGDISYDGSSGVLINTTTSVNVVFITL